MSTDERTQRNEARVFRRQFVGSLLAALLIVAVTIAVVTAKIGPGLDSQELRDRNEAVEERLEERFERLEERRED